jgi:hypothetical protein
MVNLSIASASALVTDANLTVDYVQKTSPNVPMYDHKQLPK